MVKTDGGGAAFPQQPVFETPHGTIGYSIDPGMSLRDWFAGQALAGMASIALDDGDMLMGWLDMSRAAYRAADAMLATRSKGGDGE